MSPFVAAAAVALQENPAVNAVIDDGHIVYRDYVDISIAVSPPSGLEKSLRPSVCRPRVLRPQALMCGDADAAREAPYAGRRLRSSRATAMCGL